MSGSYAMWICICKKAVFDQNRIDCLPSLFHNLPTQRSTRISSSVRRYAAASQRTSQTRVITARFISTIPLQPSNRPPRSCAACTASCCQGMDDQIDQTP